MEQVMYFGDMMAPLTDVDWELYHRFEFRNHLILYGYQYDHRKEVLMKADWKHCVVLEPDKGYLVNGKCLSGFEFQPSELERVRQDDILALAQDWALKRQRNRRESFRSDARTHTEW